MMKISMAGLLLNLNHAFLLVLLVVGDITETTDGADMSACVGEKGEKVTIMCLYYCRKCKMVRHENHAACITPYARETPLKIRLTGIVR